jgi:alpha-tubulin suppressor-like RCC1 family protein
MSLERDGSDRHLNESVSSRATEIAAGSFHTIALRYDGTVAAWGSNFSGEGEVPTDLTGVTAIASGGWYNLARTRNGTVTAWGDWGRGSAKYKVEVPPGLERVIAIAAGSNHALALISDGTVVAWGDNRDGQCDVPTSLTDVVKIAAGGSHSFALTSRGATVAWGDSNWRSDSISSRLENARLGDVFEIASSGTLNLFLLDDGRVVAWDNHADQWGDVNGGPDRGFYQPSEFAGDRISEIAVGHASYLAIRKGYVLRSQSSRLRAPLGVPMDLGPAVKVASGDGHSVALRADGTIGAWGSNEYGQATVPAEFAR